MKSDKVLHRALSIVLMGLVATVCVTVSTDASARDYRSPLRNFTVPVPSGLGMRTNQRHDSSGGRVSFHDDFGSLWAITYWGLPADYPEMLADPARRDEQYARMFHNSVMPDLFMPVSANARVLHEAFLGEPGAGRELFAVIDLPEGAALMNATTGRSLDSVRALLIFENGGFLYLLELEISAHVTFVGPSRPFRRVSRETDLDNAALQEARNELHRFRETIVFRAAAP